jgi:predicted nuclease of predicted toxin-antitoxin system
MRVLVDEDIPAALTPLFRSGGDTVSHVEDLGLKGTRNGVLLAAISGSADVLVTGDANLGHQQNLAKFDLAIILVRPSRLSRRPRSTRSRRSDVRRRLGPSRRPGKAEVALPIDGR